MATIDRAFKVSKRRTSPTHASSAKLVKPTQPLRPVDAARKPAAAVTGDAKQPDLRRRDVRLESVPAAAEEGSQERSELWELLRYSEEGASTMPQGRRMVYEFVKENCELSEGFERSREFGAHSGVSFEDRAITAYLHGQLAMKDGREFKPMCIECGEGGHVARECPHAF